MKYFKFTINRRDYKLAIDDILFIQVSKEKIGGVTGIAVVLSAVMPATPGNITFIIN